MASQSELRAFRHSIAELKRRGLVSGVDARSATPTSRLRKLVSKYDDVLSGKASAVKLTPKFTASKAKQLGGEVARPKGLPARAIIPHGAGETVRVSGDELVTRRKFVGGGRMQKRNIPVPYHNLEQYLNDLKKEPSDPNVWYCMRVFNDYTRCYRDLQLLIDEVMGYKNFESAMGMRPKDQSEFYKNLQIITVDNPQVRETLQAKASAKRRAEKHHTISGKTKYHRRMNKLKSGPKWKLEQYRQNARERQQRYRDTHPTPKKRKSKGKRA